MSVAKKTRTKSAKPKSKATPGTESTDTTTPPEDNDGEEGGRSTSMGLEVDQEVLDFIAALERFKKEHNRAFPSWSEVLYVVKQLGYRRS